LPKLCSCNQRKKKKIYDSEVKAVTVISLLGETAWAMLLSLFWVTLKGLTFNDTLISLNVLLVGNP